MTWVRLDDCFADHPKVDGLSDAAFRLHVAALCHCGRYLTDGRIDAERVGRLVPRYKRKQVDELVSAGLWHVVEGGWMVHDFLDWNPSRERVVADRAAAAERQRSHRDRKRSNGVTNGVSHASPTRPDPTDEKTPPSNGSESTSPEPVDEEVRAVLVEYARALAKRSKVPIANVGAWTVAVVEQARTEHGKRIRQWLDTFDLPPDRLAAGLIDGPSSSWNHHRKATA